MNKTMMKFLVSGVAIIAAWDLLSNGNINWGWFLAAAVCIASVEVEYTND